MTRQAADPCRRRGDGSKGRATVCAGGPYSSSSAADDGDRAMVLGRLADVLGVDEPMRAVGRVADDGITVLVAVGSAILLALRAGDAQHPDITAARQVEADSMPLELYAMTASCRDPDRVHHRHQRDREEGEAIAIAEAITGCAPSRSWTLAAVTLTASTKPNVSTTT